MGRQFVLALSSSVNVTCGYFNVRLTMTNAKHIPNDNESDLSRKKPDAISQPCFSQD